MWKLYCNLTPAQTAQVDAMFSGDNAIESILIVSTTAYRNWFGYFAQPTDDMDGGDIICRRRINDIRNWQATSHLERN